MVQYCRRVRSLLSIGSSEHHVRSVLRREFWSFATASKNCLFDRFFGSFHQLASQIASTWQRCAACRWGSRQHQNSLVRRYERGYIFVCATGPLLRPPPHSLFTSGLPEGSCFLKTNSPLMTNTDACRRTQTVLSLQVTFPERAMSLIVQHSCATATEAS